MQGGFPDAYAGLAQSILAAWQTEPSAHMPWRWPRQVEPAEPIPAAQELVQVPPHPFY